MKGHTGGMLRISRRLGRDGLRFDDALVACWRGNFVHGSQAPRTIRAFDSPKTPKHESGIRNILHRRICDILKAQHPSTPLTFY